MLKAEHVLHPTLSVLVEAMHQKKVIEFDYQGSKDNAPSKRVVNGWVVATRSNETTYLLGFQEVGGSDTAFRQYKTDDIQNPVVSEKDMTVFPDVAADPKKWKEIISEAEVVEKVKIDEDTE